MRSLGILGAITVIAIILMAMTVRVHVVGEPSVSGPIAATTSVSPTGQRSAMAGTAVRVPAPAPVRSIQVTGMIAVPVMGVDRAQIADSWGDPRESGARAHHGTDIIAPRGSLVIAAAPGRVEKLFESKAGGITAYVRSPAGKWSYYYAHMLGYAPGLHEGQELRTGDAIGYVGDTGNAGLGNNHLHFGLSLMKPQDHWSQGEPVNPYPLLAARAGGR